VRATTRFLVDWLGLNLDEITLETAPRVPKHIRERLPVGTDALYEQLGALTNTEIWFCNHGNVATFDRCEARTTQGRFRWVPYLFDDVASLDATAARLGLAPPRLLDDAREVVATALRRVKDLGAVAVKGGAYAYVLSRPFAPDVRNVERFAECRAKFDAGTEQIGDAIAVTDALTVVAAKAAGEVGLPLQIHVGLIWSASGPTRIPEIMDLTPLFYHCPRTVFVVLHGGYPRTDDLAYVAATMTNVRAELNWVPNWAGLSFSDVMGRWIDMIPCDRILYGSDAGGLTSCAHDMVTRRALAEALEARIQRGLLSTRMALEIAEHVLRINAIATYPLAPAA